MQSQLHRSFICLSPPSTGPLLEEVKQELQLRSLEDLHLENIRTKVADVLVSAELVEEVDLRLPTTKPHSDDVPLKPRKLHSINMMRCSALVLAVLVSFA